MSPGATYIGGKEVEKSLCGTGQREATDEEDGQHQVWEEGGEVDGLGGGHKADTAVSPAKPVSHLQAVHWGGAGSGGRWAPDALGWPR